MLLLVLAATRSGMRRLALPQPACCTGCDGGVNFRWKLHAARDDEAFNERMAALRLKRRGGWVACGVDWITSRTDAKKGVGATPSKSVHLLYYTRVILELLTFFWAMQHPHTQARAGHKQPQEHRKKQVCLLKAHIQRLRPSSAFADVGRHGWRWAGAPEAAIACRARAQGCGSSPLPNASIYSTERSGSG